MTLKHPYLNILGQYSGAGSVKTFPIVGSGDFSFNMSNYFKRLIRQQKLILFLADVSAAWIIYFTETGTIDSHLIIDQFLIDIIPVEIVAKFGNAIDDDDRLGKSILSKFFIVLIFSWP